MSASWLAPRRGRAAFASPARRATLSTAAAAVVNQALLLVSGALSARILGPADRGHMALLALIPGVLCLAGSMGFVSAVMHFVAQTPASATGVLRAIRRQLGLQLVGLTLVHVAVTVFWLLPSLDHGNRPAAYIALGVLPALFFTQYAQAVLLGCQRFGAYTALLVSAPALLCVGIVGLYVAGKGDLVSVALVGALAAVVPAGAAVTVARRVVQRIPGEGCAPPRGEIGAFARSSYLGQVAPFEAFRIDQLAVGAAFAPAILGYYTAATALTNLSRFLGDSLGVVLAPYIASLPKSRQKRSLVRGILVAAALCGAVTAALLPAIGVLIPLLFGDAFRPAIPLAQVLLVAGGLLGFRRAVLPGLRGIGLPQIGSYSEFVALAVFAAALPVALTSDSGMGIALAYLASAVAALAAIPVAIRLQQVRQNGRPGTRP